MSACVNVFRIVAISSVIAVAILFANLERIKCIGYCDDTGGFIIQERPNPPTAIEE